MKYISCFILLCCLTSSVLALECQYTEKEDYTESAIFWYHNDDKFGENLNLTELIIWDISTQEGYTNGLIRFHNNLEVPISLNVTYHQYSTFYGFDNWATQNLTIDAKNTGEILGIHVTEVNYDFIEPNLITWKNKTFKKQRDICKICGPETCRNDGASCNSLYDDSTCGSGICTLAGFCGSIKLIDCPAGQLNCNDKACLTPSIKLIGEAYMCDFECSSGTLGCDGVCRNVSSKWAGQEYFCIEECKSGRGNGTICLNNVRYWAYFSVFCIILSAFAIWYFAKWKRDKEEEAKDLAKQEREAHEKVLNKAKEDLSRIQDEVTSLRDKRENVQGKISNLENRMSDISYKAKENYEKELTKLKLQDTRYNEAIKKLTEQQIKFKKEIDNRDLIAEELINNTKLQIDAALKKYGSIYGQANILYDSSTGYIKFKKGNNLPIHLWLYRNKLGVGNNQEVHHIDGNKLNNEMWNLIALNVFDHKYRVKEGKIKNEGWEYGLRYLLDEGIIKEENLHRYIVEERKRRKEQHTLS